MDRRKRKLRFGLLGTCRTCSFFLALLCLLLFLSAVFGGRGISAEEAQTDGNSYSQSDVHPGDAPVNDLINGESAPLEVRLETSPANPVVGSPWAISVLVNHPVTREVTVNPPRFPAALILERVRTEIRNYPEEGRWTRVEFLFTPQRAVTVSLGPFEVSIPNQKTVTGETEIRFRENSGTVRRYVPVFRWVNPVLSIDVGTKAQLSLELSNWEPFLDAPTGFFGGRVPLNAVLEDGPPVNTGEGRYVYTIGIIPLDDSDVKLDGFSFQAGAYKLDVPELSMAVLPAGKEMLSPASDAAQEEQYQIPEEISTLPFPEIEVKVFPLLKGEYNRTIITVKALWESGNRAKALAEIRRNERDSLAGPFFLPLRMEMEKALVLGYTEDEQWRPLTFSFLSWGIFGLLLLFVISFLMVFRSGKRIRKKTVTSRRRGGFKAIIVLAFFSALVLVFLEESFGDFLMSRLITAGNHAVLERTPAYRVPDTGGAVNLWFPEGQPVITGDYRLDWCYAETSDGRSGWVKHEAVHSY